MHILDATFYLFFTYLNNKNEIYRNSISILIAKMASNLFVSTLGLSIATTYVWPNDLMTSTISPCGSQNPSCKLKK